MEKIKTLEEFAIKEIQDLRKENQELEQQIITDEQIIGELSKEKKQWEEKFINLVKNLINDLNPKLETSYDKENHYISLNTKLLWDFEDTKEEYEYYKKLFNLKEEGEEENEQSNSN